MSAKNNNDNKISLSRQDNQDTSDQKNPITKNEPETTDKIGQKASLAKSDFIIPIILIALAILIEFCCSNNIGNLIDRNSEIPLNLSEFTCNEGTVMENQSITFNQNASVEYRANTPVQTQSIFLRFDSSVTGFVSGNIQVKDDSRSNSYEILNNFSCNPAGKYNTVELPLRSNGNLHYLLIELNNGVNAPVHLQEVCLNYQKLHFNFVRFLLFVFCFGILYCMKHFSLINHFYDLNDKTSNIVTIALWAFSMALIIFLFQFARSTQQPQQATKYPLEQDPSSYSIMVQQFDALQKGQLYLDIDAENTQFAQSNNPYDASQRVATENYGSAYWDHVYYNGKLYSYFGLAPVLLFYYPYYWITGTLPTDAATACFFSILAVSFCFLLIRRFLSCFHVKAGIIETSMTFLLLPAASYIFLLQSSADFYYIPILSAITFLVIFFYCSLAAFENKTQRQGTLWCFLAGLAFGAATASRPTTVVPAFLLILPLYLHALLDKKISSRQKGCLAGGFAIPVIIVAGIMMWYNYARFGSPFDFGVTHQLTVSDIHYNHFSLSISRIVSYLHQYWFLPMNLSETFPFIGFNGTSAHLYGNYTWVGFNNIAVFAMPLNFALFLLPACVRSCKPLYQKMMLIFGFFGAFTILYVNFCLGGIQIRYACDGSLIFTILSILALGFAITRFRKHHLRYGIYLIYLLFAISILTGYLFIFNNERNYIQSYAPDAYLAIKQLFTLQG